MSMSKLLAAVTKAKSTGFVEKEEEYFYYPARDQAGNGSATIRFLHTNDKNNAPFVKTYKHNFQNKATGKWLIEECLSTIEQQCPVCEANRLLYAAMPKDEARKFGMNRKTSYIARILVIEDKKNPENEGKVFLYKFGKKVFDKACEAMSPVDEDDTMYNVFNDSDKMFDGKAWPDFKLKIRKVDNETNYDKSTFEAPSKDVDMDDVTAQFTADNTPQKFVDLTRFKAAEKLQERLNLVNGNTTRMAASKSDAALADQFDDVEAGLREVEQKSSKTTTKTATTSTKSAPAASAEDDDIEALMRSLAS